MVESMNRENEKIAGIEAADHDFKRKKFRDLSIYGSVFYTDAYKDQMQKNRKTNNKGGK